jgi:hypothetical protein
VRRRASSSAQPLATSPVLSSAVARFRTEMCPLTDDRYMAPISPGCALDAVQGPARVMGRSALWEAA